MKSTINQFLSEKVSVKNRSSSSVAIKKIDKNDEISSVDSNSTKLTCKNKLYNLNLYIANETCSSSRKRSKISVLMEKLEKEIKEYDEIVKKEIYEDNNLSVLDNSEFEDDEDYKKNTSEIQNEITMSNYKKFKVFFYFEFDENYKYVFPIESDSFNIEKQCVNELIKNIVKIINNKRLIINYKSINYFVSLKDCEDNDLNFYVNNYELKPCKKKNNFPKNDFPNYSPTSLLKNIANEKISFISKNSLNIMLFENYEEEMDNKYDNDIDNDNKNVNNNDINIKEKEIKTYKDSCDIF